MMRGEVWYDRWHPWIRVARDGTADPSVEDLHCEKDARERTLRRPKELCWFRNIRKELRRTRMAAFMVIIQPICYTTKDFWVFPPSCAYFHFVVQLPARGGRSFAGSWTKNLRVGQSTYVCTYVQVQVIGTSTIESGHPQASPARK